MSTIRQAGSRGLPLAPTRKRATFSIGFCVADSPIRSSGRGHSACRRSSDSARWLPRLLPARAWISSTISAHPGEHLPARLRAEQDVQRFGRGDQDVRRALAHRSAFDLRRIAGAHRATDIDVGQAETRQFLADAGQRLLQVDADVVGQRFQRRDIDYLGGIRQLAAGGQPLYHQGIDGGEEGGQGLARTGGRGDQGRKPLADRRPGLDLGRRGRGEVAFEPLADGGMELRQGPRSRLGAAGGRG